MRIAEIAHIIAASEDGPRADPDASSQSLARAENLIVLCPNTHTVVDAAPEVYTVDRLQGWKSDHAARLDEAFGVCRFDSRTRARSALEVPLDDNFEIWQHYGPESPSAARPDSEAYDIWVARVMDTIIPNNRTIRRLLDSNRHLLTPAERAVAAAFRRHERAFAARHMLGEFDPTGARFPGEMNSILLDR